MPWWPRSRGARQAPPPFDAHAVTLPGWQLEHHDASHAAWRDREGDIIRLSLGPADDVTALLTDRPALERYCRAIAERDRGGLIEVSTGDAANGPCVSYIYKCLPQRFFFAFFGWLCIPFSTGTWVWMIATTERGGTGVRESEVTAMLLRDGQWGFASLEQAWASDPYDPTYSGVDRSVLRSRSDASEYDSLFPDHPLTKVRRELQRLAAIQISPNAGPAR